MQVELCSFSLLESRNVAVKKFGFLEARPRPHITVTQEVMRHFLHFCLLTLDLKINFDSYCKHTCRLHALLRSISFPATKVFQ